MAATGSPVVEATHVKHRFDGPEGPVEVLVDVELSVAAGEAVAILGPSGSGKSTLLGQLAGLDRPDGGAIRLLGTRLDTLDEDGRAAVRAGRVGFVFQAFQLLPALTALDNVCLPLELAGWSAASARRRGRAVLAAVGLEARLRHLPGQLSGGEQQRVAVARAFAVSPAVLFADEPTGNLDPATGERVTDLLFDLRDREGSSLVMVTHDRAVADRCDRVYRLREGRLCAG